MLALEGILTIAQQTPAKWTKPPLMLHVKVHSHKGLYSWDASNKLSNYNNLKINIIRPQKILIENILDFDPLKIKNILNQGYIDAKNQYII